MDKASKSKIVIATGLYPPESGGPATFAKLAEDNLSRFGYDVEVLPFSEVRKYPKVIRHIVYFFKLLKLSKRSDLILALDPVSVGLPAMFVAKVTRKPFIVRLGGDYAWEQGKQRFGVTCSLDYFHSLEKKPLGLKVFQKIQSTVVKNADKAIAPSQYLKSIIVRWGISADKIEVVHSVSYLENRTENSSDILDKLSIEDERQVVLSVSRLVPWKGFLKLIDVVQSLKETHPNILLLIGGDGPQFEALQQKIDVDKLHDHVRLLGRLRREEIEALSARANVFALNTEYEGFSHLLIECMQLGMPIVTTNVGGNPELVKHNETGLLVPYNDATALQKAISVVIDDSFLANTFRENGRKHVQNFTIEKSLSRLDEVLQGVLNSKI